MQAIADLQKTYIHFMYGLGPADACIQWAVDRLQQNEEGDDTDITLLAGAWKEEEVRELVPKILARYLDSVLSEEYFFGKYIVELHERYLAEELSAAELDPLLRKMYYGLLQPGWLAMLSRNCEYATDMEAFKKPFEDEFTYIAGLWKGATSLEDFMRQYDRNVSNQHDV